MKDLIDAAVRGIVLPTFFVHKMIAQEPLITHVKYILQ